MGAVKIRMYLKIVARLLPPVDARAGTDSPCALRSRISLKELALESDDFGAWLAFALFEPSRTFEPAWIKPFLTVSKIGVKNGFDSKFLTRSLLTVSKMAFSFLTRGF